MNELEELARAQGMSDRMINRIIRNSNKNMGIMKLRRQDHRYANRGWDKKKNMRAQAGMSVAEYLLLQHRYFPDGADDHERAKLQEELMRRFPHMKSWD